MLLERDFSKKSGFYEFHLIRDAHILEAILFKLEDMKVYGNLILAFAVLKSQHTFFFTSMKISVLYFSVDIVTVLLLWKELNRFCLFLGFRWREYLE